MVLKSLVQRHTLVIVLVLSAWAQLWSQSTGQSAPAPAAKLSAGTIIRLRTTQLVDSKDAKAGDKLPLEVMRDVRVGDLLVIAKHTPLAATLTQIHAAPRGARRGSLTLEVKTISDITGNPIAVGATKSTSGPSKEQVGAYTQTVLSMGFLAPLLFFAHGDEAVLPKGSEIDPTVSQDVSLNVNALRQRRTVLDAEQAIAREQSRTGLATVHFYFHHLRDEGVHQMVLIDGQKVVRLRDRRFFDAHISPGHHVVACCGQSLELDAKPDEQYYVNVIQKYSWVRLSGTAWLLRLTDLDTGEEEMYPLMPAEKIDVYSAAQ
jgi:hypothetical protein